MNIGLSSITSAATKEPPRIVIHTTAGWGKSSMFAHSKAPIFLMAKGETGLETLITSNQIPPTPHFPELQTWGETKEATRALLNDKHDFKTCVIDAGGGFEALCHQFVCDDKFGGDWSEKGFQSFQQGYTASIPEWNEWLALLDVLRKSRNMAIVMLCHTHIKPYNNPEGPNYDRFQVLMHHKTWGATERWSDIVLFGNYVTPVEKQGGRAKASGGQQRIIYTQRSAAYDAKNRHGLPESIDIPSDGPEAAYNTLREAFKNGA